MDDFRGAFREGAAPPPCWNAKGRRVDACGAAASHCSAPRWLTLWVTHACAPQPSPRPSPSSSLSLFGIASLCVEVGDFLGGENLDVAWLLLDDADWGLSAFWCRADVRGAIAGGTFDGTAASSAFRSKQERMPGGRRLR